MIFHYNQSNIQYNHLDKFHIFVDFVVDFPVESTALRTVLLGSEGCQRKTLNDRGLKWSVQLKLIFCWSSVQLELTDWRSRHFSTREKGQTSDFISLHTLLLPAEGGPGLARIWINSWNLLELSCSPLISLISWKCLVEISRGPAGGKIEKYWIWCCWKRMNK